MTGWCDAITTLKTAQKRFIFFLLILQELTKDRNFLFINEHVEHSAISSYLTYCGMSAKQTSFCDRFP